MLGRRHAIVQQLYDVVVGDSVEGHSVINVENESGKHYPKLEERLRDVAEK